MEENRRPKRSLRNTNPCNPIPNIFKKENDIPDRLSSVPDNVIDQVLKISNLTCEEITRLSFPLNDVPSAALKKAKQAVQGQQNFVQRKYPQGILQQTKVEEESSQNVRKFKYGEPQLIRSEDESYGEGILGNKMFRSDLENLLIN